MTDKNHQTALDCIKIFLVTSRNPLRNKRWQITETHEWYKTYWLVTSSTKHQHKHTNTNERSFKCEVYSAKLSYIRRYTRNHTNATFVANIQWSRQSTNNWTLTLVNDHCGWFAISNTIHSVLLRDKFHSSFLFFETVETTDLANGSI